MSTKINDGGPVSVPHNRNTATTRDAMNENPISHSATNAPLTTAAVRSSIFSGFSLMRWLRLHGVDIIAMALMGALGLGIYEAPPAPNRSFPVFSVDGNIIYPQFAYPMRKEIIPIWLSAFLSFIIPFITFALFQIRRKSIDDFLTTTLGVLKSLITAAVFQVFLKCLIGGFRPHFLAVCKPNIPEMGEQRGNGFDAIYYDRSVCTGDTKEINDSLESFPSGHSTAAFAGFVYLALYLNAQLKVMSSYNPAYWKMIAFFAPLLGATLIAGSLTIDEYHHWYDVLAGAIIGSNCAVVAFRMTFASLWDFRFNHILLPRTTSFFLRQPAPTQGEAHSISPHFVYAPVGTLLPSQLPFTRQGGWGGPGIGGLEAGMVGNGAPEGWPLPMTSGAPFDATAIGSGAHAAPTGFGAQRTNGGYYPGTSRSGYNEGNAPVKIG